MKIYVPLTFVLLGFVYYEASGGADFVPEDRPAPVVAKAPAEELRVPVAEPEPEPAPIAIAAAEPEPAAGAAAGAEIAEALAEVLTAPEPAAEPEAVAVAEAEAAAAAPEAEFASLALPRSGTMIVNASSLNVRSGPSTGEAVVGRLTAGDEVSVALADSGNGWTLIRVEGDGIEGWVATRFLSE